jgi:uncharacterized peroxidase-related enzyme
LATEPYETASPFHNIKVAPNKKDVKMSNCWIMTVAPHSATGRVKEVYKQVATPHGNIDNVYRAQSLRPETILGHDLLYKSVLHFENPACSPWYLAAVAVYTSVLNRCPYAVKHHFANMEHLLGDTGRAADILKAFQSNRLEAAFAGKELLLMRYARKLTKNPADLNRADIESLQRQGVSDEEILEVNQVSACFNYSNRVINGLGVRLGNERIGYY